MQPSGTVCSEARGASEPPSPRPFSDLSWERPLPPLSCVGDKLWPRGALAAVLSFEYWNKCAPAEQKVGFSGSRRKWLPCRGSRPLILYGNVPTGWGCVFSRDAPIPRLPRWGTTQVRTHQYWSWVPEKAIKLLQSDWKCVFFSQKPNKRSVI